MVSPNPSQTEVSSSTFHHNRGFISEESVVAVPSGTMPMAMYRRPFWTPVVAATLFVYSVFALSWYLMLGCHVGINGNGMLALGGGAAVWMWVTACVAYFCGGMILGAMMPTRSGWIEGAALWGLSIPLALVIYSFAAGSGMAAPLGLPRGGMANGAELAGAHTTIFFAWASFITLILGLAFSVFGSFAGIACRSDQMTGPTTPSQM